MDNQYNKQSNFQVITGGLHRTVFYDPIRIVAAPEDSPPFHVEAMAYEEDTFLIMSADPDEVPTDIHPIRMMAELEHFKPQKPGSVVVRKGIPLRLLAVVHDVNQEPTCHEKWVEKALHAVFREVERRGIQSLGIPLLATRHGRLPQSQFARLLGRVIATTTLKSLKRLWVMAPVPDNCEFTAALEEHLGVS